MIPNFLKGYQMPLMGYENTYTIDELGNVCKADGTKLNHQLSNGYPCVHVYVKNKRKKLYIHRLIATHFISNPENKATVNHKDGNKLNYSLSNLEWATQSENNKHAYESGLKEKLTAKNCYLSKIVLDTLTGIFYDSAKEAAETIGMHQHTFRCKLNGWTKNNTRFIYA